MRDELAHYRERGFRIIYLDECMVTKTTLPTHAWSNFKSNINVTYNQYNRTAVACLAGVSVTHGLDHLMLFDSSVNNEKFK